MKKQLVIIVHNVRSCHNVGSIFRSADAFAVDRLILSGYTPFPKMKADPRLPHEANSADKKIAKTALGAQLSVEWRHETEIELTINNLKTDGFTIAALEQTDASKPLSDFKSPKKLAVIVGREVEGIEQELLDLADLFLEIPMSGTKESLNVGVAAALAMYQARFR